MDLYEEEQKTISGIKRRSFQCNLHSSAAASWNSQELKRGSRQLSVLLSTKVHKKAESKEKRMNGKSLSLFIVLKCGKAGRKVEK